MPPITASSNEYALSAGATEAEYPALAGEILYDEIIQTQIPETTYLPFQFRVVRSARTGLLDFYYAFTTLPDAPLEGVALTFVFPLPGLTLSFADFRPDGLGTAAPGVFEWWQQNLGNNVIDGLAFVFGFEYTYPQNTRSRFFFVSTNAKEFSPTAGHLWNAVGPTIPGPTGF